MLSYEFTVTTVIKQNCVKILFFCLNPVIIPNLVEWIMSNRYALKSGQNFQDKSLFESEWIFETLTLEMGFKNVTLGDEVAALLNLAQ